MKSKVIILAVLFIFLGAGFAAMDSNAQTRRKRTQPTRTTPTPVPTTQTEVVVVSRAEDQANNEIQPNQNQAEQNQPPPRSENRQANQNQNRPTVNSLDERIRKLEERQGNNADERQKRLAMSLEILSKAEQRAEALRKQLFEMIEKQTQIQSRIEQINFDLRPEMIERYAGMAGTLRPEEVRESRRRTLETEKRNLESLLNQITASRIVLEQNLQKADMLVEKLREKLEKEIDENLSDN